MKESILNIVLCLICSFGLNAQEGSHFADRNSFDYEAHKLLVDSLSKIDYLSYDYKYLDKGFKLKVGETEFKKAVKKFDFYPERIRTYRDSLGVVLMMEFNNWHQARIAESRISFSWLRLSYFTWQEVEEVESYTRSFDIVLPWRMYEFLIDEKNDNPKIIAFLEDLKDKVKKETKRDDLDQLSRKDLLTVAMRCNPQRIADYEKMVAERKRQRKAYVKEHGEIDPSKIGVGCGKENCCQSSAKK